MNFQSMVSLDMGHVREKSELAQKLEFCKGHLREKKGEFLVVTFGPLGMGEIHKLSFGMVNFPLQRVNFPHENEVWHCSLFPQLQRASPWEHAI